MAQDLLLAVILAPLAQALAAVVISRPAGLRDSLAILFALVQVGAAIGLAISFDPEAPARLVLAQPLPGVALGLQVDPLGASFAVLVAVLGGLTTLYAVGFARSAPWPEPGRLFALMALAIAATHGVAFSANLFTFFLFSEALTIAVFALIALPGDARARDNALKTGGTLLIASFGLLLPAIIWTAAAAGGLDFKTGGILAGKVDPVSANILFLLFMAGFAKAGLMPFHAIASSAAVAPAPVAAILTAVCAISVGGFSAVRVALNIFGPAMADAALACTLIGGLAAISALAGALIALGRADLRERVAFLALSHSALVFLSVVLAAPAGLGGSSSGWFAAIMLIGANALSQATLTLSLGAIVLATGRSTDQEMSGLGRSMPFVFLAFTLGAVSLIGLPPMAGAWSKLWLFAAAGEAGAYWAMAVAMAASLLVLAAIAPVTARALTEPAVRQPFVRADGAPLLCLFTVITAGGLTALLVFFVDPLARFLQPLWVSPA
jgi:multicomponent Na+:H+ antiporter subunit D